MASNAIAERKQSSDPIRQAVDAMAPEFKAALPAHVPVDKFVRVAMTAINSNPDLRQADHRSLFGAVTKLAQDGLLPDGREAALVIFNTKNNGEWIKKVQAMPMVAGLLKMMRQSGEVAWVDAQIVRQNDSFQYRPGLDEMPIFEPDWFADRGPVVGAYAVAKLKSGEIVPPEIMSVSQIEEVRNVSRSKDKGPWVSWYDQMALKTVLRRYLKRLPTSTDLLEFMDRDETMSTTIEHKPTLTAVPDEPAPSRLDALEHHIEEETNEAPAWQSFIEDTKSQIEASEDLAALSKVEKAYLKQADGLPEDVAADMDAQFTAARRALERQEGEE